MVLCQGHTHFLKQPLKEQVSNERRSSKITALLRCRDTNKSATAFKWCPLPLATHKWGRYAGRNEGPVRRARGRGVLKEFSNKGPLIFPFKASSSALKRKRALIWS